MTWLQDMITLASVLGALAAWSAKILWARAFAEAKNEVIRAKEAQIDALRSQLENLRELTPMKVREYFISVRTQLEDSTIAFSRSFRPHVLRLPERILRLRVFRPKAWREAPRFIDSQYSGVSYRTA